jgi:peptide/nickel transport system permease protein
VIRFCARRVLFAVVLVLVVSSTALVLTRLAPGDFTTENPTLAADDRARLRHDLGLDRPILSQYFAWLGSALRLDFGQSLLYSRPVSELLGERALNTSILALAALILATLLGVPAGIYTGTRSGGAGARLMRLVSVLLLSVPPLVGSLALVLVAARTGWFPVGGMTSLAAEPTWYEWLADLAAHLPVPMLALGLPLAATLERVQSQSIAEASRESFVRASRARGVSMERAILRHAWPVSLGPVLGLYGLIIGALFSGSFVVEVVTAWPGLGRLMFDALRARDLYLVVGTAAAGATCLAVGTLLADLMHAAVDPRILERR